MKFDVAVIGGGAAGLACAAHLAENGKNLKIALIDAGERLGKKLAATGNGQGNVSNTDMSVKHYRSGNLELVEKIACRDAYAGAKLFDCLFGADERGRIYPCGRQASALTDNLISKLTKVEIFTGDTVEKLDRGFSVYTRSGKILNADYVALCTGGKVAKQYKCDGTSYSLATAFGHTLTPLYPSLVQIKTETEGIKTLKGIRADCNVRVIYRSETIGQARGDVIFTDYGVSGNAVFSLSPLITDKSGVTLSIEFLPDVSTEDIIKNLAARRKKGCAYRELLSGTLHNQVGRAVIARAGQGADDGKIAATLKNFLLPVTGSLGFDYAQVTRGGINMSEITNSLESRLQKNLFFAGEILDVDGDCGGYNLQWAFTSGVHVAEEILCRTAGKRR